jgi:alkylhydroperoxidase family enzyme
VDAVLADWRTAPVSGKMRAALGLIEKLTLLPEEITRDDIEAVRAAGVTDDAIEDAAFVCALFTTYVRLADTFKFDIPPAEGFEESAKMLLKVGYGMPGPIAWLATKDG